MQSGIANPELKGLVDSHEMTKAQFGKLEKARATLDAARRELDGLTKLGDFISPEDVIGAAGKLVAHGLSPMAVAKLLSDMPDAGPALSGWVAQHAADLTAREAQLDPVLAQARHQLGVSAMQVLVGHHFASPGAQPGTSQAAGGELAAPGMPSDSQVPESAPAAGPTVGNPLAAPGTP